MNNFNPDELSPGIRGCVLWLRANGFETVDSGDGSNHAEGMECATEEPNVAITCSRDDLLTECDRVNALLNARGIPTQIYQGTMEPQDVVMVQASYSPSDGICLIMLMEFGSKGYLASIQP